MSLSTNLQNLATRTATEAKSLRVLVNGNVLDLSSLTTTSKVNLVSAINEVKAIADAAGESGGAANLDQLSDVAIAGAALGHVIRHNGTQFVNVLGTDYFEPLGAAAAAVAALVDSAPGTLDTLNELAAALGDDPNFATTVTNAIATKQPLDATLTALAGVTVAANQVIYATGADTFAVTSLSAFARTLLDDADAATARTTLDVYSKTEIGNPETDLVAVFEAGLA